MKQLRILFVALLFVASISAAFGQAANDNFANRFVISGQLVSTNGTTVGATREAGEPVVFSGVGSVWYEWTAVYSSTVTISISGSYRETIAAYTGTAVNALTPRGSASAGTFGTAAAFSFTPTAGTAYKIQVDGRTGTGTFTLTINQPTPPPTVSITAPTGGQTFTNPVNITLTATASSPAGGTVTNVTFYYAGTTVIGTLTNSPYTMVWSNITASSYTLTAKATDTTGLTGTSAGVNITVRPFGYFSSQLVGSNSVFGSNSWWRYKDDGSDQGTAWQAWGFDDSSWPAGPGQLGYGDGDEATVVGFGPDPNNKYITTYFRTAFTVTDASLITNLVGRFLRDDGVVGYLNGVEVIRNGVAAGENYLTLAGNAADDGTNFFTTNIVASLLTNGVNVFAAQIHQTLGSSTDISWYLELTASGAGTPNAPPTVNITNPINSASFPAPATITITATAGDSDGTVTNVTFYQNGVKIQTATNASSPKSPSSACGTCPRLGLMTLPQPLTGRAHR